MKQQRQPLRGEKKKTATQKACFKFLGHPFHFMNPVFNAYAMHQASHSIDTEKVAGYDMRYNALNLRRPRCNNEPIGFTIHTDSI